MKLVTWIVMLCNKRWQRKFDVIVASSGVDVEPVPAPPDEVDMEIIHNQPAYLSHRFQARVKRRHSNRTPQTKVNKEEALAKIMQEELAGMVK